MPYCKEIEGGQAQGPHTQDLIFVAFEGFDKSVKAFKFIKYVDGIEH